MEDLPGQSGAGLYDSVIGVEPTSMAVKAVIEQVFLSFNTMRAVMSGLNLNGTELPRSQSWYNLWFKTWNIHLYCTQEIRFKHLASWSSWQWGKAKQWVCKYAGTAFECAHYWGCKVEAFANYSFKSSVEMIDYSKVNFSNNPELLR